MTRQPIAFGSDHPLDAAPRASVGAAGVAYNGRWFGPNVDSISTGASGNDASHNMNNGAQRLAYNRYTDPGRSTVFGDGRCGTGTLRGGGRASC